MKSSAKNSNSTRPSHLHKPSGLHTIDAKPALRTSNLHQSPANPQKGVLATSAQVIPPASSQQNLPSNGDKLNQSQGLAPQASAPLGPSGQSYPQQRFIQFSKVQQQRYQIQNQHKQASRNIQTQGGDAGRSPLQQSDTFPQGQVSGNYQNQMKLQGHGTSTGSSGSNGQKGVLPNSQRFNSNILKIQPGSHLSQPQGNMDAGISGQDVLVPQRNGGRQAGASGTQNYGPRGQGQGLTGPQQQTGRRQRNQIVAQSLNVRNNQMSNNNTIQFGDGPDKNNFVALSSREKKGVHHSQVMTERSGQFKKNHHRNHTHDNRVMEVEDFEQSHHQGQFQHLKEFKSGSIPNHDRKTRGSTSGIMPMPNQAQMNSIDSFELATSKPLNSSRVIIDRRFPHRDSKQDFSGVYGQSGQPSNRVFKPVNQSQQMQQIKAVSRSLNINQIHSISPPGSSQQQQQNASFQQNQAGAHRTLRPKTGENSQSFTQGQQQMPMSQRTQRQHHSSAAEAEEAMIITSKTRQRPNRSEHRSDTINQSLKMQNLTPFANNGTSRSGTGGKMMLSPVNQSSNGHFAHLNPQLKDGGREQPMTNRPFSHENVGRMPSNQRGADQPQKGFVGPEQPSAPGGIHMNLQKYKEKRQAKYSQQSLGQMAKVEPQHHTIDPDQKRDFKSSRGQRSQKNQNYFQQTIQHDNATPLVEPKDYNPSHTHRNQLNKSHEMYKGDPKTMDPKASVRNDEKQVQLSRKLISHQQTRKPNTKSGDSHVLQGYQPKPFGLMKDEPQATDRTGGQQTHRANTQRTIQQTPISKKSNNSHLQQQYEGPRKVMNQGSRNNDNDAKATPTAQIQQQLSDPNVKVTTERFNCITKFAFATSVGHQPGNPYKQNQDSYILVPNMLGKLGLHFFSVCDGHGLNGHYVSQYIKEALPAAMEKRLEQDKDYLKNNRLKEMYDKMPANLHSSFMQVHEDLLKQKFDTQLSGSTCVSVLFDRNTIFCANAGDSRAVLYSYSRKHSGIKITPLSEDHKPCMPIEKKRVLAKGGRVDTIKGHMGQSLGPQRVWLMDQDAPGLAMSRSVGDYIAHSVGVAAEPEIMRFELQPEDKFMIIASDGVWEFLTNEMVAKIVWPFYIKNSPEQAGNAIVRAAAQKWRENDTVIDDITCVTIFLEVDHKIPKIDGAVYKKALINSSTDSDNEIPETSPPVAPSSPQQQTPAAASNTGPKQSPKKSMPAKA